MTIGFIVLGFLTGIVSGLFGVGGGIIMVPVMIFVFKLPKLAATATSLMAMVLPVGALGIWQYYKNGHLQPEHLRWGLLMGAGLFVGTYVGARVAPHLPTAMMSKAFSVLLVYAAYKMWTSAT
jgi:uncharacterized membrane protein YfcA